MNGHRLSKLRNLHLDVGGGMLNIPNAKMQEMIRAQTRLRDFKVNTKSLDVYYLKSILDAMSDYLNSLESMENFEEQVGG